MILCHENAECVNTEGTFMCMCNLGFTGDGINNCTGKYYKLMSVGKSVNILSLNFRNLYYWFGTVGQ